MTLNVHLAPFLTAYDPSDLPGGSIDPLGFERGYLLLADKILPGLTNAAGRPRYFSVMCAATLLAPPGAGNHRSDLRMRAERVLLFERFWAAANVLASERDGELSASGIRGVTYAQAHVRLLKERDARSTDADFRMLAHQERYGAIGIYANVAGYLRLLNRAAMLPTQDLGERLGSAFLQETGVPARLRAVIRDGEGTISLEGLREWGHSAHIAAPVGRIEGECLGEALVRDPVRSRFADLLRRVPAIEDEPELSRLQRIGEVAAREPGGLDLKEAIDAILAFEHCYQLVLLGFERLLWLCKGTGTMTEASVVGDTIINQCSEATADATENFQRVLSRGTTELLRRDLDRLHDVEVFLSNAGAANNQANVFIEALLNRHTDVQRGKFDRGRRKLPWIGRKSGRYELTLSQVGDISGEPKTVGAIRPHEYRLAAADRFIAANVG